MRVSITDDLDLGKIADSGQCFRAGEFPDGTFRFITGRQVLYIRQTAPGEFEAGCTEEAWERVWASYFDLGRDYRRLRQGIPPEDGFMRRAAEAGRGIRVLRQDPWETLVTFILSQRKSIPAIKGAVERLAERFGEPVVTPRETVYTFPGPDRLAAATEAELRSCSLGYRAPYVMDAAQRAASGEIDLKAMEALPDAELLARLRTIRGVGIKVANCVGLFAYGRASLAPVDTWIRRIIALEYAGRDPFPGYGQAAGILQQYAFYYAIRHKAEVKKS